jgi:hypothetical protein
MAKLTYLYPDARGKYLKANPGMVNALESLEGKMVANPAIGRDEIVIVGGEKNHCKIMSAQKSVYVSHVAYYKKVCAAYHQTEYGVEIIALF